MSQLDGNPTTSAGLGLLHGMCVDCISMTAAQRHPKEVGHVPVDLFASASGMYIPPEETLREAPIDYVCGWDDEPNDSDEEMDGNEFGVDFAEFDLEHGQPPANHGQLPTNHGQPPANLGYFANVPETDPYDRRIFTDNSNPDAVTLPAPPLSVEYPEMHDTSKQLDIDMEDFDMDLDVDDIYAPIVDELEHSKQTHVTRAPTTPASIEEDRPKHTQAGGADAERAPEFAEPVQSSLYNLEPVHNLETVQPLDVLFGGLEAEFAPAKEPLPLLEQSFAPELSAPHFDNSHLQNPHFNDPHFTDTSLTSMPLNDPHLNEPLAGSPKETPLTEKPDDENAKDSFEDDDDAFMGADTDSDTATDSDDTTNDSEYVPNDRDYDSKKVRMPSPPDSPLPKSRARRTAARSHAPGHQASTGKHLCLMTDAKGNVCNRAFTRIYDLSRHQENLHATVRKFFYCDKCDSKKAKFSRLDALTRHMRLKH